ncbi:hypothetical protein FACHB389_26710 [Nostoc calcicola FACHB-389]|nr:hypothetical protein FACHB389_26710 [Nostoc calcicola FACHB-389]
MHKYFLSHAEAQRRREENAKKDFCKKSIEPFNSKVAALNSEVAAFSLEIAAFSLEVAAFRLEVAAFSSEVAAFRDFQRINYPIYLIRFFFTLPAPCSLPPACIAIGYFFNWKSLSSEVADLRLKYAPCPMPNSQSVTN